MNNIFLTEKATSRISELAQLRYRSSQPITNWQVQEDTTKQQKYPPKDFSTAESFNIGDRWEGRDYYLWIQTEVELPNEPNTILFFDFGHTGGGGNSGFESLLFIDDEPYQGVDSNHQEVFLKEELLGKKVKLSLKLWSGLEGGGPEQTQCHQFKQADIIQLDPATDDLYYTLLMLKDSIKMLSTNDAARYPLEDALEHTLNLLDWSYPGSEDFYESVEQAETYLNKALAQLPKESKVTITAVGHTHIDVAWLWRLKHTREKTARSFSTVLQLMDKYPEYIFLHTSPQVYKYIKEDYPELYGKIKQRIAEGRWEIDGAMWLEADCNIPSGESLTRQILHGAKFVKEEFKKEMHYLWLPDVFGYSWALPQIMKKSGIDTFMTTKISWNQFNRMPHDTFIWKGMDGTEILTHFITTPTAGESTAEHSRTNWFYTYNGDIEADTVVGSYQGYRDKDFNSELLLSYGYGDGGGGVNRDMLEKRRRLDMIPGMPNVKTGRADEYFNRLHETVDNTDHYVHTWDGELYLEYHRGTYTSQANVKKNNRKTELALRELEMLYSFTALAGQKEYPQQLLYDQWEVLLRNQFHDIIPGSSIKEVYQDYREEFAQVKQVILSLAADLETENTTAMSVVNTAGWQRRTLVELPETVAVTDKSSGQMLPSVSYAGMTYAVVEVSALGKTKLSTTSANTQEAASVATVQTNELATKFYTLTWNDAGQLTSIFDKENQREVLKSKGNVFQLFEDKPMNFDNWDIDIFYQEKSKTLACESLKVVENNPLFVIVETIYAFGTSKIKQQMKLYAHTRRIDFVTEVDWQERQQLLKVGFDVAVRTTEATYDIQYGNVKRPTHWNTSWDMAKFEVVGHQWADLSQRDYGVSLLNDCKYGYDIKDTTMRLTLLKGGIYPDPTADIGHHEFIYSLLPHEGDFVTGRTVEEAWEINQPLSVVHDEAFSLSPIKIVEGQPLMIDALKQAEDRNGFILRCHEHTGANKQVMFELDEGYCWNETDLMERDIDEVRTGAIAFKLSPYEIKTIRINKVE